MTQTVDEVWNGKEEKSAPFDWVLDFFFGLNNLAPDIVEAIVAGAEPDGLSIAQIMKHIPEDWNEQRRLSGFPER